SGGQCFWRVWPQSRRGSVEPAHVALVDRLDVVTDRAVVPVGWPRLFQCRWHLEHFGDLNTGVTLVQQPQCLVVQVGIQVTLHRQKLDDALTSPGWAVVR